MTTVWIVQEGDFCTSFTFAARNNKSVLPVFITMSDSDVIDARWFLCAGIHSAFLSANLSGSVKEAGGFIETVQ